MDDFLREKWVTDPLWSVTLSDGSVVVQDDGRPGEAEPDAWRRLAARLAATPGLAVTSLKLSFRAHEVRPVPEKARGYFFRKAMMADLSTGAAFGFYLVGHVNDSGLLLVQRWKVPDLVKTDEEFRAIEGCGHSLILNP